MEIIKKYKQALNDKNLELNEAEKQIAHIVAKEKIIATGDYNLSGERYKEVVNFANQKWEMKKISELIDTIIPPTKIQKSNFSSIGKYPIIDQSQEEISGWTNDESAIINEDNPLVIFGDHTCAIKYFDKPFAQGADGIKIIKTHDELLPKFLYFYLRSNPIKSDGYKRHFRKLMETRVPFPPLSVQKEIVEQIEVKQNAIDHAKAIIQNLERERRYFGQALRKIEGVEWVELGEIIKTITPRKKIQKSNFGHSGRYPIIDQSQSEIAGWTDDEKALIKSENPVIIFGDHTCSIKYSEIPFAQGADGIKILTTNEKLLPKFLYFFLKSGVVETAGYKRHFSKLKETKIPLPSLEIQKKLVAEAEKEQEVINANKQLIEIYEQKISDVLSEI